MPDNSSVLPAHSTGATRRSVARGAAWAVPAVTLAAAAPAFAVSNGVVVVPGTSTGLIRSGNTYTMSMELSFTAGEFRVGSVITFVIKMHNNSAPATVTAPAGWTSSPATQVSAANATWRLTFTTTSASPTLPFRIVLPTGGAAGQFATNNPTITVAITPKDEATSTHVLGWL